MVNVMKLNGITDKNLINMLKKSNISPKNILYGLLIMTIIMVVYVSSIIYYLNTLKSCSCYQIENKLNYSNITYLIVIEAIILAASLINLTGIISSLSNVNKIMNGGGKSDFTMIYLFYLLMLIIDGLFIYYVYKLSQNVNEDCECTKSWLRYLLYIQAIYLLIVLTLSTIGISHIAINY